MRKILYWTLTALLTMLLVISVGYLGIMQVNYHRGAEAYAQAEKFAGAPDLKNVQSETSKPSVEERPDEVLTLLSNVNLESLRTVNTDVVGWICIPETELSYPLVQGEDNKYYLNHTWQRQKNAVGAVFPDYRSSLTDPYFVIYAHRVNNGSMFGTLGAYSDALFWEGHPSVYLVSEDKVERYDIFAAFETSVLSEVYDLDLKQRDRKMFLSWCLEQSVIDTGLSPDAEDRIVCLSTCTASGKTSSRWVVLAALASFTPIHM